MQEFSLLYPQGIPSDCKTLGEETINDLSIDLICETLGDDTFEQNVIKNILIKMERNPAVIQYRTDIFDDIVHFPKLRERIKDLLEQLAFLKELERSLKDTTAAPIWQLINRLNELEIYVNCISGINEALTENNIQSEGLRQLQEYVSSVYQESGFEYLKEDIQGLVNEMREIKSVSVGVNLDNLMRPVEVGIVSINTEPFTKTPLLSRFLDFATKQSTLEQGASFHGMTQFHTVGKVAGEDPFTSNLTKVMSEMLAATVRRLKSKLSKYTNISGYSLTKLIPEFIFYIRWADYIDKIQKIGIPMCKPEIIADNASRSMYAKGLYNFKLAIQRVSGNEFEIVPNDIDFDEEHRIYIMTGPNRGGKTTLTQAVGLVFLMAQCGIYAPCESVRYSPADCIYTHFPADENKTVNLGRLGEESKRMSEIFRQAANESLLLFNESLATTSFAEGLYIAKDVVKALRYLGARTIFNTHMHELAMNLDEVNSVEGNGKVASLITGIHEGKRSYKIFIAPPEGVSYAQDIAKKYGVTFTQLKTAINK